jgi:hypothetical protein
MAGDSLKLSQSLTSVPTMYADGVANLARGPGIVKFYLTRFDPDPDVESNNPALNTMVGQVVMSATGFAATVLFFKKQLDEMLERGEVDRAVFAELVKAAEAL